MTRSLLIATLLCGAAFCLDGPALAQPLTPAEPACLRQANIYDFHLVPGNRSLIVIDRSRRRYRLDFMGKCFDIQYDLGLTFKSHGIGGLSCLAKGDSVLLRNPAGPNECFIRDIQYQTPALDRADLDAAQAAKQR